MTRKTKIAKTEVSTDKGEKVFRLTEIDPEFVSLVRAGANRQKAFMVIKAEDAKEVDAKEVDAEKIIPGLAPSPWKPSPKCPNCGKTIHRPIPNKCPHCGHSLKLAEDSDEPAKENSPDAGDDTTTDDPPANVDTGKTEDTEDGTATEANGDSVNGNVIDLTSWLDEAGAAVEELTMDLAIQQALEALDGQTKGCDEISVEEQKVKEVKSAGTPPENLVSEEGIEKADESEQRIAKLEGDLETSRVETRKARREVTALKAKIARLSKGVCKSSVILTGEVTAKTEERTSEEKQGPSRGTFTTGGDIAAALADE